MGGIAIWITGLPGSGKSTVADAFVRLHPGFMVLRMDEMRKVVTPEPTYSDEEREMLYRGIVYLAKKMADSGLNVVIDATGHRRRWRDLARELIPGFIEVFLNANVETCMQREQKRTATHGAPRDIYLKGSMGAPVPGVTVPYEESSSPELIIDAENTSAEEAARIISDYILSQGRLSA